MNTHLGSCPCALCRGTRRAMVIIDVCLVMLGLAILVGAVGAARGWWGSL